MAADLNRVTLIGRLTRDPELRHSGGGDPIASLRLAVSSRGKVDGEWADKSNYFDVTVFGRQAENATTYLEKGSKVGVDGRLSWREWTAQDGSKRQSVEVVANDLFYLSFKEGSGNGGEAARQRQAQHDDLAPAGARSAPASSDDDDIPF